jgi:hypothetical protein
MGMEEDVEKEARLKLRDTMELVSKGEETQSEILFHAITTLRNAKFAVSEIKQLGYGKLEIQCRYLGNSSSFKTSPEIK